MALALALAGIAVVMTIHGVIWLRAWRREGRQR